MSDYLVRLGLFSWNEADELKEALMTRISAAGLADIDMRKLEDKAVLRDLQTDMIREFPLLAKLDDEEVRIWINDLRRKCRISLAAKKRNSQVRAFISESQTQRIPESKPAESPGDKDVGTRNVSSPLPFLHSPDLGELSFHNILPSPTPNPFIDSLLARKVVKETDIISLWNHIAVRLQHDPIVDIDIRKHPGKQDYQEWLKKIFSEIPQFESLDYEGKQIAEGWILHIRAKIILSRRPYQYQGHERGSLKQTKSPSSPPSRSCSQGKPRTYSLMSKPTLPPLPNSIGENQSIMSPSNQSNCVLLPTHTPHAFPSDLLARGILKVKELYELEGQIVARMHTDGIANMHLGQIEGQRVYQEWETSILSEIPLLARLDHNGKQSAASWIQDIKRRVGVAPTIKPGKARPGSNGLIVEPKPSSQSNPIKDNQPSMQRPGPLTAASTSLTSQPQNTPYVPPTLSTQRTLPPPIPSPLLQRLQCSTLSTTHPAPLPPTTRVPSVSAPLKYPQTNQPSNDQLPAPPPTHPQLNQPPRHALPQTALRYLSSNFTSSTQHQSQICPSPTRPLVNLFAPSSPPINHQPLTTQPSDSSHSGRPTSVGQDLTSLQPVRPNVTPLTSSFTPINHQPTNNHPPPTNQPPDHSLRFSPSMTDSPQVRPPVAFTLLNQAHPITQSTHGRFPAHVSPSTTFPPTDSMPPINAEPINERPISERLDSRPPIDECVIDVIPTYLVPTDEQATQKLPVDNLPTVQPRDLEATSYAPLDQPLRDLRSSASNSAPMEMCQMSEPKSVSEANLGHFQTDSMSENDSRTNQLRESRVPESQLPKSQPLENQSPGDQSLEAHLSSRQSQSRESQPPQSQHPEKQALNIGPSKFRVRESQVPQFQRPASYLTPGDAEPANSTILGLPCSAKSIASSRLAPYADYLKTGSSHFQVHSPSDMQLQIYDLDSSESYPDSISVPDITEDSNTSSFSWERFQHLLSESGYCPTMHSVLWLHPVSMTDTRLRSSRTIRDAVEAYRHRGHTLILCGFSSTPKPVIARNEGAGLSANSIHAPTPSVTPQPSLERKELDLASQQYRKQDEVARDEEVYDSDQQFGSDKDSESALEPGKNQTKRKRSLTRNSPEAEAIPQNKRRQLVFLDDAQMSSDEDSDDEGPLRPTQKSLGCEKRQCSSSHGFDDNVDACDVAEFCDEEGSNNEKLLNTENPSSAEHIPNDDNGGSPSPLNQCPVAHETSQCRTSPKASLNTELIASPMFLIQDEDEATPGAIQTGAGVPLKQELCDTDQPMNEPPRARNIIDSTADGLPPKIEDGDMQDGKTLRRPGISSTPRQTCRSARLPTNLVVDDAQDLIEFDTAMGVDPSDLLSKQVETGGAAVDHPTDDKRQKTGTPVKGAEKLNRRDSPEYDCITVDMTSIIAAESGGEKTGVGPKKRGRPAKRNKGRK